MNIKYEYADIILSSFVNLGDSELKKIKMYKKLLTQVDIGHYYLKKLPAFDALFTI